MNEIKCAKPINIVFVFIILLSLLSCSSPKEREFNMTTKLTDNISHVSEMNVFFGHQSVGENIISGLESILNENNIEDLKIVKWEEEKELHTPAFLHAKLGQNTNPKSKCDAFADFFDNEAADSVDVALLKFCYIDINENTNIAGLFSYYKNTLDTLKNKFPNKTFVHVTVPLMVSPNGLSVKIREVLGKPNRNKLANIKRNEFNNNLRDYYKEDPIFDLAAAESTYSDGKREGFTMNGTFYYSLIDQYASDGRHLNELGSKVVAEAMINTLASIQK